MKHLPSETSLDPAVAAATRSAVGLAALRRIRRIVEEDLAEQRWKAYWAKHVAVLGGVAVIVGLTWLAYLLMR